ncbi:MAG: tetratricopeptide repeat protein, partial [Pontixanthobacter sp.]
MTIVRHLMMAVPAVALAFAAPAQADLERGSAAWERGDYETAVSEWRDLSNSGNPDAQFNMAQAYRLGRGVVTNMAQAEILMAKAAAQGHMRAIDIYGLLLFQDGRRKQAMPYVAASAERGNPRAQYLLGISHFNGDLATLDWVRAYALITLANNAGFEPARNAAAQMDDHIPLEQRQQA